MHLKVGMEKLQQSLLLNLFKTITCEKQKQAVENLGALENWRNSKAFGIQELLLRFTPCWVVFRFGYNLEFWV
jgi:hypothetical protein